MGQQVSDIQVEAQRSFVLRGIVYELGGIAHENMDSKQLDGVIDSMLSKGIPRKPSVVLMRWIHTHKKAEGFKIAQILGAHMPGTSIIPGCFGKFYDSTTEECGACLDRVLCRSKCGSKNSGNGDGAVSLVQIKPSYKVSKDSPDTVSDVITRKSGQIAKALTSGDKVSLIVYNGKLRIVTVNTTNQKVKTKETVDMAKNTKTKPEPEELDDELELDEETGEDEELEEDADEVEDEESEDDVEDEEEEAPKSKKSAGKPAAKEAPAKAEKPKKEKPKLNAKQQEFQDALDAVKGEDKYKVSAKFVKTLKLKVEEKGDARIDHMRRVMEVKKALGGK